MRRPVFHLPEHLRLVIEIGAETPDAAYVSGRVTSQTDGLVLTDGVFPSRALAFDALVAAVRSWLEPRIPFDPPPVHEDPPPSAAELFLERMGPVAEQLLQLQLERAQRARASITNPRRRPARKGGKR